MWAQRRLCGECSEASPGDGAPTVQERPDPEKPNLRTLKENIGQHFITSWLGCITYLNYKKTQIIEKILVFKLIILKFSDTRHYKQTCDKPYP